MRVTINKKYFMHTQCDNCFTDYIVQCNDTINVFAKLQPNEQYYWVITDKFTRQYAGDFTTDVNGFWAIPVTDLPEGLLTEYSGTFTLQVFADAYACSPLTFLIAQEYDCLVFNIRAGTRVKNNLGCEF